MKFLGITSMDEKPQNYAFSKNLIHDNNENKKKYLDKLMSDFLDEYILQKRVVDGVDLEEDYVCNYALCFISLAILLLQLKDTANITDGERNLINQKMLLIMFRSMSNYSKYAIEMFVSVVQMEYMLPPKLCEEFKWGFFSNCMVVKATTLKMTLPKKSVIN